MDSITYIDLITLSMDARVAIDVVEAVHDIISRSKCLSVSADVHCKILLHEEKKSQTFLILYACRFQSFKTGVTHFCW